MSDVKVGDRVRVTFEATVTDQSPACLCTSPGRIQAKYLRREGVSVEKIEPAERFGPGDVVRDKGGNQMFLLTTNGYVQLLPTIGQHNRFGDPYVGHGEEFTSEDYVLVKLVETPF